MGSIVDENKYILVFKLEDEVFGFVLTEKLNIYKIEKKEFVKIKNVISIKSIIQRELNKKIKNFDKIEFYNIISYNKVKLIVPFQLYKIKIDEEIKQDSNSLLLRQIKYNETYDIKLLSLDWIEKTYFQDFVDLKQTIRESKVGMEDNSDKEEQKSLIQPSDSASSMDVEKKAEIYSQIDKEIDKLKISNFYEVQKKYSKATRSFTPQLIILYSILIFLAIAVIVTINLSSSRQQAKIAEDIKTIGSFESIVIKELQKKQEKEKDQLNEQLKAISEQLSMIQKEKDQFLKNQDLTLIQKTKEIEDEYQKRLNEENAKLAKGLISKAEYDRRYKQIIEEKDKRLKELREQKDIERKAYLEQINAKEKQLNEQKNIYQTQIEQKNKEIAETQQSLKVTEEKLAMSQEEQKRIEKENEQLKQTSAQAMQLKETIANYYRNILTAYRKENKEELRRNLEDFYNFLNKNPLAALMMEDERDFNRFVVDFLFKEVQTKESEIYKKIEKSRLLELAFTKSQKGDLTGAYDLYYQAFTKYDVIADNQNRYFEDFISLIRRKQQQDTESQTTSLQKEIEEKSSAAYAEIKKAYDEKKYNIALQLALNYLNLYKNSSNAFSVVEYKVKSELALAQSAKEEAASKLYTKAKNAIKEKKYDDAYSYVLELLGKYPGSSYAAQSTELLDQIFWVYKSNISSTTSSFEIQESLNEVKVGAVLNVFPEAVQVLRDLNSSKELKIGDLLTIKRKDESGNLILIADIQITSIAQQTFNCKILKLYSKVPQKGDLVFIKK